MEQMDISATSSESSSNESLIKIETVKVKENDIEGIIINDIDNSIDNSTVESKSNDSMEGKRVIYYQRRSSLLNTKSFLMNSMLHFQDRDKIVAQLSKKKSMEPKCRNFFHGRLYNYVLPAPKVTELNQVETGISQYIFIIHSFLKPAGGQTGRGDGQGALPGHAAESLQEDCDLHRARGLHLLSGQNQREAESWPRRPRHSDHLRPRGLLDTDLP